MKLEKKFIAAGLGIAIFFAGNCISYSYFTDEVSKSSTISIGKLVEDIPPPDSEHKCDFDTNAKIYDDDELKVQLNTSLILSNNIEKVSFIDGYGEFKKDIDEYERKNNAIKIEFETDLDIENIDTKCPSKDYIILEIKFKDGTKVKYRVDLMRQKTGDKYHKENLCAHWSYLETLLEEDNKEESIPEIDDLNPEEKPDIEEDKPGEEENPDLKPEDGKPGEEEKPELKPEDGKPGEEEKPELKPEDGKPGEEEKPELKPEDGKPGEEEKPDLKPEEDKPAEEPKPEPKPEPPKPAPLPDVVAPPKENESEPASQVQIGD